MKYLIILSLLAVALTGCAHDVPYGDREYGMATTDAFDRQVAYKDYRYANKPVEGMDGLHAEKTMEMYHNSFGQGFTQESIEILSPGN